jgi:methionyl-tRNA formyltransferase
LVLNDVAMVAADTSRSRAYIQALERAALLPAFVVLLESKTAELLPGQIDATASPGEDTRGRENDFWNEVRFDPALPVKAVLERSGIPHAVSPTSDINDPTVVRAIGERSEPVFIYSGFGGVLLKQDLLATGKRFLHAHGGYLPDFKGSTTNYYSLLAENTFGASSLFLSAEIDSGPVLLRRKYPPPPDRRQIDHVYDSAARALVLIETLRNHAESGTWRFELPENSAGETYYIIHPVLKHIGILASDGTK